MVNVNATQLSRELKAAPFNLPTKAAVRLAQALIAEDAGDTVKAEKYLDAAIDAENTILHS